MSTSAIAYWYHDSLSHPKLYTRRHHTNPYDDAAAMPQYDAYEEPLPLSPSVKLGEGHDGVQTPTPTVPKPTRGQPHVQGSDIYKIADHEARNDPFHNAMSSHTHNRHSSLTCTDTGTNLIPTTLTHPAYLDSPKVLSAEEDASLAAYAKAQADNDSIRLILACERCGHDLAKDNRTNNPKEFAKEAHMLNGGWMHRSRQNCELLSDRPAAETWESLDVEALRARPRGAL